MAALIAAGLGLASGIVGSKSARKSRRRARRGLQIASQRNDFFQGLRRNKLQTALKELGGGFDDAGKQLSRSGNVAKRDVGIQEDLSRGRLEQNIFNTGFGNSSIKANAERGLGSDTSRRLAEIDQGLGRLFSNLAIQRAQATTQVRGQIADTFGQQGLAQERFADRNLDLNTTSFQGPQLDFSGIAAALLALFEEDPDKQKSLFGGGSRALEDFGTGRLDK